MPDLDYTQQRFSAGVLILATHHGRINERLYSAYEEAVKQVRRIDDIEDLELALDIEVFHRWMTEQTRAGNRGSAILAMSEDEAGEAAKELVDLEARIRVALRTQRSRGRPGRVGSSGAGARSPEVADRRFGGTGRTGGGTPEVAPAPSRPVGTTEDVGRKALRGGTGLGRRPSPTTVDLRDAPTADPTSAFFSRSD
jgi:hypothetical protein